MRRSAREALHYAEGLYDRRLHSSRGQVSWAPRLTPFRLIICLSHWDPGGFR